VDAYYIVGDVFGRYFCDTSNLDVSFVKKVHISARSC
jgi:hypothetical protein